MVLLQYKIAAQTRNANFSSCWARSGSTGRSERDFVQTLQSSGIKALKAFSSAVSPALQQMRIEDEYGTHVSERGPIEMLDAARDRNVSQQRISIYPGRFLENHPDFNTFRVRPGRDRTVSSPLACSSPKHGSPSDQTQLYSSTENILISLADVTAQH